MCWRCLPIYGFQKDWVELHVGHVVGRRSWEEHIWVEPEFIELVGKKKPKMGRVKQSAGFRRVLK
jgi:hypothetical protein